MKLPPPPAILRLLLSHARVFWRQWNIQSMLLSSFIIQLVLFLLAPFRRKTSNVVILASIWLAYLLADWIAIQAIGLISNPCRSPDSDDEIYAFWAQFLLLHLGGPDTITALALEDNELWLRTSLHLAVQIYGGLGILVKSVAHSQSSIWLPTMLMFTAGVFKYMERVSSLFHGRLLILENEGVGDSFRINNSHWPTDVDLVKHGLKLFQYTKGFYKGQPCTQLHLRSTQYMYNCSPNQVYRVLEVQLNMAYETMYSKMVLICTKSRWKVLRLAVTLLQVGCLVIWLFFADKDGFKEDNIRITNTLLIGALVVDVFAFLRVQLWADWTIAHKVTNTKNSLVLSFYKTIISVRNRTWGRYSRQEDAPFWTCFRRVLFRRWSESIPQLSLISACLPEESNKLFRPQNAAEKIKQSKYVMRSWFSDDLWDFLYKDVMDKKGKKGGIENIGQVKGGWTCLELISNYQVEKTTIPTIFKLFRIHVEYSFILIRWHMITELCYHVTTMPEGSESNNSNTTNTEKVNLEEEKEELKYKEICKTLSDYLMYLLIHRHDLISVSTADTTNLQWTWRFMNEHFKNELAHRKREPETLMSQACMVAEKYFGRNCDFNPEQAHVFPIKMILNELEELEKKKIGKWKFMSKVWGELLYYAAIQCKPNFHASNLKQGGELLTLIWLFLLQMQFGGFEVKNTDELLYLDESNIGDPL